MRVLAFGEILWDIIDTIPHLGGAPFNFAAHSVQCGNEAFIISRLGNDSLGKRAFDQCKLHGVKTDFIQWDDQYPTGTVDVRLNNGQPDYTITKNVAYDFIASDTMLSQLQSTVFDVFYFGSLIQRSDVSAKSLHAILNSHRFRNVFYDVNLRKEGYSEKIIVDSISIATVFKLNHEEVPILSATLFNTLLDNEKFCSALTQRYHQLEVIIITAADKGCYVYFKEKLSHTPCDAVKVADAVGAGDAFSAAFMYGFINTHDPIASAKLANLIGGFVASERGAIPTYSPEIRTMLKNFSER